MTCYCGNQIEFTECCEPIHKNPKAAKTAESLMRARYSAFATGHMDFIEETHDPRTRQQLDMDATRSWAKSCEFENLEIVSVSGGESGEKKGTVEFKASFNDTNSQDPRVHRRGWCTFPGSGTI